MTSTTVFQELPIKLHNSSVVMALLMELEEDHESIVEAQAAAFDLTAGPYLEKHVELLNDCVDELANESYRLQYYERNVQRQRLQQQQTVAQRKPGEEESEAAGSALKPVQAPSRLEALLVANQISHYCDQINRFSSQNLSKLYLMNKLAGDGSGEAGAEGKEDAL